MSDIKKQECPRILIVDDDPDHCQLLCDSLEMYYHMGKDSRLDVANTGKDCLDMQLKDYDVVLLDLHLPDMTGLAVLEEMLARADLPVIFVTGENDLAVAAQAIEAGAQDYIVKQGEYLLAIPAIVQKNISLHRVKLENDRLQLRLHWMLEELQSKNQKLEESMEKLKTMATTDALTGMANRRYFNEQLKRLFNEASRYDMDLSCCMIDLDHYKQINDTLGHQVGDEILQMTADEIRSSLRGSDIAARYGGDEFILLLPHTGHAEAAAVLERIREKLARAQESREGGKLRLPVTLSIGIASIRADYPNSADSLVSMADRALYRAKELGKDRIVIFSEMRKEAELSDNAEKENRKNTPGDKHVYSR